MKKVVVSLLLLVGMITGNAAFAHDWFNRYDYNHDRRWDRHEFFAAQRDWGRYHHGYPQAGWGPGFSRFDRNHDRYWNRHEAWGYHHW